MEAYRLQRRLAKSGGVAMTRTNDYEVCRTVFEKYVRTGAAYPIFMPNYSVRGSLPFEREDVSLTSHVPQKLEITSAMAEFKKAISEPGDAMVRVWTLVLLLLTLWTFRLSAPSANTFSTRRRTQ